MIEILLLLFLSHFQTFTLKMYNKATAAATMGYNSSGKMYFAQQLGSISKSNKNKNLCKHFDGYARVQKSNLKFN